MMLAPFFAIGSITDDLQPYPHPGGVAYIAVAAARLGHPSHIITQIAPDHPYSKRLQQLGITIHNVSPENTEVTLPTFENVYDSKGNRKQRGTATTARISRSTFAQFPPIAKDAIVFISPYIEEVDEDLFPLLSKRWKLTMTPQGNFRSIGADGIVRPKRWKAISSLSSIAITILSEEDITFPGAKELDKKLLDEICFYSPIVLVTRGLSGVTLFEKNKEQKEIKEFPLRDEELKDFTGAGDCFATAFMHHYTLYGDTFTAAAFANLYSAMKINSIAGEGLGIDLVPTEEEMQAFISKHTDRFQAFLKSNDLEKLTI